MDIIHFSGTKRLSISTLEDVLAVGVEDLEILRSIVDRKKNRSDHKINSINQFAAYFELISLVVCKRRHCTNKKVNDRSVTSETREFY